MRKPKDLIRKYINGRGNPVVVEIVWNERITGTKGWSLWIREGDESNARLHMIGTDDNRITGKRQERDEFASVAGLKLWRESYPAKRRKGRVDEGREK